MQLRILVSSASASQNWDLRCFLREHLIQFIARNYPGHFPQLRMDGMATTRQAEIPLAG